MMSISVTDQVLEKVGIDLLGPLPKSSSGNVYAIVVMHYPTTKWPEVFAVPNKTAKAIADFFYRDIICRHGCPKEVISDNGSEFKGDFALLLQKCGIDHRLTAPNHPQANGRVEHFNGTLATALRKTSASKKEDWDQH